MNGQVLPGMIDAQSHYGGGVGTADGADYVTNLAQTEVKGWKAWAAAGTKMVPTVSAGRDARPRHDYAMPWGPVHWSADYVKDPTMYGGDEHWFDVAKSRTRTPHPPPPSPIRGILPVLAGRVVRRCPVSPAVRARARVIRESVLLASKFDPLARG